MSNSKAFWLAQMLALLGVYAVAAVLALQGHADNLLVKIVLITLAVHVLEIPVAFVMLKNLKPQPLRVAGATALFGASWWLPARRGIFAVN